MKKSLSAIFCLVIMLSLSVPVSASAFDSSNYASSNSSAVAQSQYEMLMDSFGFDSSLSDIVYVCRGFVSAGHAYSTGDSATLNGMTIGVCVDSAFSGRNDAALIKITNSNYSMSDVVNVSNHTLSNDKYMLVSEGSTIYKVGSTSGYRSGTVTSTNGSVTYRINNQPLTISNVLVTDAMNLGGDSGGIVYCKSGSNYYAIGTASGSKHSTNNLTEDTFIECYVSQMIYAIQPLDCSYLPLS